MKTQLIEARVAAVIRTCAQAFMVAYMLTNSSVLAAIPEPDVILYGTISINGVQVLAGADVAVIARVTQAPQRVGIYRMDDCNSNDIPDPCDISCAGASCVPLFCGGSSDISPVDNIPDECLQGNNYVLRIRMESGDDNSTQSASAARVGQSARIYVQQGVGAEVLKATIPLTGRGLVLNLNLPFLPADIDLDGDEDFTDVNFFVQVLLGLDLDPGRIQRSDQNGNGQANGADVKFFVDAYIGG